VVLAHDASRRLFVSTIASCLLLALAGLIVSPRTSFAAAAVPLAHYDLSVQLDQDANRISTSEIVRFTNLTGVPLSSIVFKVPLGGVTRVMLSGASVDGQVVSPMFDATGSVLELALPASLSVDATSSVELDWSAQIPTAPGRLSDASDVISLGNWFPTLAVHHGDWDRRPYSSIGDPFYTELADFDLHLGLARPAVVAFTGDLVSQNGTNWEISARSVRDFALAISADYQQLTAQLPSGQQISVYALDGNRAQAELDAAQTFATAYAGLVGPYPLSTLRVAETGLEPAFAGMEYPGLVFISASTAARSSPTTVHGVVAHEVAHQWFYGLIGDDEVADPWLDEAFATFLPDEVSAANPSGISGTAGNTLASAGDGVPIDKGIFDFPDNGAYAAAVYARGGRFLAELRNTMGDADWTTFLHALYATYAGKVETPRAVLDMAQRSAPGTNLMPLFRQYTDFYSSYSSDTADTPPDWSVQVPRGEWAGTATVDVEASFPVTSVELWLDDWQIAQSPASGPLTLDLSAVPAGDYVLLARVTDSAGTIFERATRVSIGQ
jgi:hypothetical protein